MFKKYPPRLAIIKTYSIFNSGFKVCLLATPRRDWEKRNINPAPLKNEKRCWVNISGQNYEYTLRRKARVKYLRLSIEHDGTLTLTAPITYPVFLIKKFLASRFDWIIKGLEKKKANPTILGLKHNVLEIKHYKKQARVLVNTRLEYFNQHYNFKYNRVAIRNQKSRWGSCSSSKNLNFNYRLAILPVELTDYIIVHELCHLGEMNHSRRFWQLVSEAVPDYKDRQKKLKKI